MPSRPDPQWQVYRGKDELPPPAASLLGDDVTDRFEAYQAQGGPAEPVVLAAVDDDEGEWLAAMLLLIEPASGQGEDGEGGGDGETVGSIQQLVVPPDNRGQGLGGRLIRRAESLAREAGATRLRSTAGWGCPDHLGMYDRLRFERLRGGELPYLVSKPLTR